MNLFLRSFTLIINRRPPRLYTFCEQESRKIEYLKGLKYITHT